VRRYQRRTPRVDEANLGVYLAGPNIRRIEGAPAPLLRGEPLSKDAVSRRVGRLRENFDTWRNRIWRTERSATCSRVFQNLATQQALGARASIPVASKHFRHGLLVPWIRDF
jgi:hypothetical protein